MYRIAICDDEAEARRYVAELVRRWAEQGEHDVTLREYPSAEGLLFGDEAGYDILLLDIEMGGMNGVDLARSIRGRDAVAEIIFVTGYSDYIAEGYNVAALQYLMKPVAAERLAATLDRAAERLHRNERSICLETADGIVRAPLYSIKYIDVQRNYATVHAREDITVRRTLSELAGELDERFFRLGRSAVVNLYAVRRVTRTDVYLDDGTVLPLPRGCYEPLNRALIEMK